MLTTGIRPALSEQQDLQDNIVYATKGQMSHTGPVGVTKRSMYDRDVEIALDLFTPFHVWPIRRSLIVTYDAVDRH